MFWLYCPMSFQLPFISSYSLKYQLGTLFLLLLVSYLHRGARLTLAFLASLYIAFFSIVPVLRWTYSLFKAIAMLGFYVYFFLIGLDYILSGLEWARNKFNSLLDELKEEQEEHEHEHEQEGRRRRRRKRNSWGARRWNIRTSEFGVYFTTCFWLEFGIDFNMSTMLSLTFLSQKQPPCLWGYIDITPLRGSSSTVLNVLNFSRPGHGSGLPHITALRSECCTTKLQKNSLPWRIGSYHCSKISSISW